MAVPSSGQLSLFGIAMEMVHADYDEPQPVPTHLQFQLIGLTISCMTHQQMKIVKIFILLTQQ